MAGSVRRYQITGDDVRGEKTIIVGDVNTGKSIYTLRMLDTLAESEYPSVAVIDCAPQAVRGIGGKMREAERSGILYLTTTIAALRLTGTSDEEILALAAVNARTIESIFDSYLRDPREILFINDVTLYLQAGSVERFVEVMESAGTLVMNAYRGTTFQDSPLSRRERRLLGEIMQRCNRVIGLSLSLAGTEE